MPALGIFIILIYNAFTIPVPNNQSIYPHRNTNSVSGTAYV